MNQRGKICAEAIRANRGHGQRALFGLDDPSLPTMAPGRTLWVLLVHTDEAQREVRAELSLPASLDRHGRVDSWHHRHLIEAVAFETAPLDAEWEEIDQGEEIDVPLKKRKA